MLWRFDSYAKLFLFVLLSLCLSNFTCGDALGGIFSVLGFQEIVYLGMGISGVIEKTIRT